MASNTLHYLLTFLFFKGNIIWTCSVGTVTSLSVAVISFAKKVFSKSENQGNEIVFTIYNSISQNS